jgi:hypothetical protein
MKIGRLNYERPAATLHRCMAALAGVSIQTALKDLQTYSVSAGCGKYRSMSSMLYVRYDTVHRGVIPDSMTTELWMLSINIDWYTASWSR